jgi:glycosyltransferase involved in cell wall biosynthesis
MAARADEREVAVECNGGITVSRVDVIIPCYKYARYLAACVESVVTQDGVDVRALVIDDASPDDTPAVAARLTAQDPRVEYRRHTANRGHIATYNEGLEWASGDYVLLLSADDLVTPGALGRAARLMDAHPSVGLTYGMEVVLRSDGPPPPPPPIEQPGEWTIVPGEDFVEGICATSKNPVPTPSAIARTSVHKRIGGYRPELTHSGDMEMWLRFGANADVGIVNAYQAYYRKHSDNMARGYSWPKDFAQRKAAFDSMFREHGERLARRDALASLADRSLAQAALVRARSELDEGHTDATRELMSFARTLWSEAPASQIWTRLVWKQRLGPVWSLVRRVRGGAR